MSTITKANATIISNQVIGTLPPIDYSELNDLVQSLIAAGMRVSP